MNKRKLHEDDQPEIDVDAKTMGDCPQQCKLGRSGSNFSAQCCLSEMSLPYPPLHMWSHPLFRFFLQTLVAQYPVHRHDQEMGDEHVGHEQDMGANYAGIQKTLPKKFDKAAMPCTSTDAVGYSTCSSFSNLNPEDSHVSCGRERCYHPYDFFFPTWYSGQLDPLILWMDHMQRQASYLFKSGRRNSCHCASTLSSYGGSLKDLFNNPLGILRRHTRPWEMQSFENMQVWTTVMYLSSIIELAEAEICHQHGNFSKLEDDLQHNKARQDFTRESVKDRSIPLQPKQVRTNRMVKALLDLPADRLIAENTQANKARGCLNENDILKILNAAPKEKIMRSELANITECIGRSLQDVNEKDITSFEDKKESLAGIFSDGKVDGKHVDVDNMSVQDMAAIQQCPQNIIRAGVLADITKETSVGRIMDIEWTRALTGDNNEVVSCSVCMPRLDGCYDANTGRVLKKFGETYLTEKMAYEVALSNCSVTDESINIPRNDSVREAIVSYPREGLSLDARGVSDHMHANNPMSETDRIDKLLGMRSSEQRFGEIGNMDGRVPNSSITASDFLASGPAVQN